MIQNLNDEKSIKIFKSKTSWEAAFPLDTWHEEMSLKIQARLPEEEKERVQFLLFVNARNIDEYPFIGDQAGLKDLTGNITLDSIEYIDKKFRWDYEIAKNRLFSKLRDDQMVRSIAIKNVSCTSSIIQELINLIETRVHHRGLTSLHLENFPNEIRL